MEPDAFRNQIKNHKCNFSKWITTLLMNHWDAYPIMLVLWVLNSGLFLKQRIVFRTQMDP